MTLSLAMELIIGKRADGQLFTVLISTSAAPRRNASIARSNVERVVFVLRYNVIRAEHRPPDRLWKIDHGVATRQMEFRRSRRKFSVSSRSFARNKTRTRARARVRSAATSVDKHSCARVYSAPAFVSRCWIKKK